MKINKSFWQFLFVVLALATFVACQSSANSTVSGNKAATQGGGGATPTEAYKNLYAAVKSKNTEAIKQNMSKATQEFAVAVSEMQKKTIEDMYKNGFTETTMSDAMPPMRNERVKDNMGALEVRNSKGEWEDLSFVLEDGGWKLAVGDIFKGTYKKPAPSIAETEANTNVPQIMPAPNADSMTNTSKGSKTNPIAPPAATDQKPEKPNSKQKQ